MWALTFRMYLIASILSSYFNIHLGFLLLHNLDLSIEVGNEIFVFTYKNTVVLNAKKGQLGIFILKVTDLIIT